MFYCLVYKNITTKYVLNSFLFRDNRDMAEIIDKQGEMVEEIHASTEASRERAEVGLEEVKKAADYQPVCIIS